MDVGESYRLARGGSRDLPEARDKGILGPRGGTHRGLSQGNRNVKEWSPKVDPHEGKALISPQPPPPQPPTSELLLAENKPGRLSLVHSSWRWGQR